ncbi:MAG: redox-sensing transcriptional repressor Rex [Christensenellales bacterium]|jgi:redox-sensing transcriptional repressor
MSKTVSEAVIKRLPKYYKHLKELEKSGISKVSSGTLAEMLNITASQVRQDFCNFGGFGQQGYGYDVSRLKSEIANILGLNRTYNIIIIGAGNIGRALASYKGFKEEGFEIIAAFDIADCEHKISVPLYYMDELENFVMRNKVDIAIIATQKESAQEVAKRVSALGVKNFWNFAPVELKLDAGNIVENVFMSESLQVLSYRMNNL